MLVIVNLCYSKTTMTVSQIQVISFLFAVVLSVLLKNS